VEYSAFLNELGRAGLNVRQFADLVGMNRNSVSNYASGNVPNHLALIAVLLGELHLRDIDYGPAVSRVAFTPRRPRGGAKPGKFGGDRQKELDLR
jgi:transcriptional regulator with XRE-family HTH domain